MQDQITDMTAVGVSRDIQGKRTQYVHSFPHTIAYAKNERQNRCCHHNPKECADNAFAH